MLVVGTRRLCRVGLVAILATALCALTLVDLPPRIPDPPYDPPPTMGGEPPGTKSIVAYSWARRLALDFRPSKECDRNGTYGMDAFELHGTKWLETIPRQIFLYSAHLDLRVADYPSVRVIGVKQGLLRIPTLFCTVWYEEQGTIQSISMEASVSNIWLDEWGGNSYMYTGILVTCPLPRSEIHPSRIVVDSTSCKKNPSHSLLINSNKSADYPNKSQFTLCIKGLDFDEDISRKLIAFVELNRILGVKLFYFYVFSVHNNVLKVLRFYERSNVVKWIDLSLPGDLPNDKIERRRFLGNNVWTKRRMELIPYNHCFYENLYSSEFVVPIDIDETIIPVRRRNWSQLMLDEKKKLGKSFKDFASYSVRNIYFFPDVQERMQTNFTETNRSTENPNYLDIVRAATISPEGDSVKSFISTKRALTVHNHYALATLNPSTRRAHHLDPEDVLKHHHRVCDGRHLDCDLLMENVVLDQSALRYADELKARMKTALTNLNDSLE